METITKNCNTGQAFNFNPDDKQTFGYLTSFVVGDQSFVPDFKLRNPMKLPKPPKPLAAGDATELESNDFGLTMSVVGVLESLSWEGAQTAGKISLVTLISAQNTQLARTLKLLTLPKYVVTIGFIVYEYDAVAQTYFESVVTFAGRKLSGSKPAEAAGGFGANKEVKPIYALLVRESGVPKLDLEADPVEDIPGVVTYKATIEITAATSREEQQIKLQTSKGNKLIKRFGVAQF